MQKKVFLTGNRRACTRIILPYSWDFRRLQPFPSESCHSFISHFTVNRDRPLSLINPRIWDMIAAKSPIHSSPQCHPLSQSPSPTRLRCSPSFACFSLGFRSKRKDAVEPALSKKMEWARRIGSGCLSNRPDKGLKLEADSGGVDVFDSQIRATPEHLVIMVNGLGGSAADWSYAADQFVTKLPDKIIVHRSECNTSRLTFDGVDTMGERLADEVLKVVRRRPGVQKISFVAHSLGGLVARYAVGRLFEQTPRLDPSDLTSKPACEDHADNLKAGVEQRFEARIAGLEPINFITVATPHLGSRGHKQLPFLCGLPFLERRASQTAHLLAGRSGKHLFLTDNEEGKLPLLLRMVNDNDNLKFISALRAFKRRVAYANVNYDHMVGWSTSSIRRQCELPKYGLLVTDEKYPHILHVKLETTDEIHNGAESIKGDQETDLEEEMIRGLAQVPWERVDVSFQKSKQRYIAHTTIQVKSYWLNSDGADVVFHMIDNFLL